MTQPVFSHMLVQHKSDIICLYAEAYPEKGVKKAELCADLIDVPTIAGLSGYVGCKLAGFILAQQVCPSSDIIELIVAPSFRRIGIAAGLLDALVALSQSRNISELFLEVAEDNEAAQALYLTCGFQNVGKRNRYYQRDGHSLDAIIMKKRL